jgi:hypothetical protein
MTRLLTCLRLKRIYLVAPLEQEDSMAGGQGDLSSRRDGLDFGTSETLDHSR